MKSKKVLFVTVVFFVLLLLGFWFFFEESSISRTEIDNEPVSLVGNLIIDNLDLEQNSWHLSYERPGNPGLLVKLITEIENSECSDLNGECIDFFQKNNQIAGKRVEVFGVFNDSKEEINISRINFLELDYSCNFEFSDFPAERSSYADSYFVDFSTKPEAEDFKTRIEETVKNGPNFGGKFVYVEWGCGTNCGAGAIVNPISGEVIEYGIMNSHGVELYKDSNLLIVNPPEILGYIRPGDLFEDETSRYYIISENGLLFLCEQ